MILTPFSMLLENNQEICKSCKGGGLWNGIDKIRQQLADAKKEEIENPKSLEEAKTFCDIFADKVKEAQRQTALENEYTKTIRALYLKVDELDKAIAKLNENKNKRTIAEYDRIYAELLEITEKQNKLYSEISQYREITPEQQEKGFL